jgi:dipeptidyl aminopeptidase/acylaminoacyl peptidase
MRALSQGSLPLRLAAMMSVFGCGCGTAWASECAAYLEGWNRASLVLFPVEGSELSIALPPGLPSSFFLIASSPDGKAIYGYESGVFLGITKIEFKPLRQSIVPGSSGIGRFSSLTLSPTGDKMFVSGSIAENGHSRCGDFEIDVDARIHKPLRIGSYPDCGGPVSSDGKRELNSLDGELSVLDLENGASRLVGKGLSKASWSPDGRWIAAVKRAGRIILIDAANPSTQRSIGTGDGPLVWSPDSRHLLTLRSEPSCKFWLYGQDSLQIIDVDTGKQSVIKSSHCKVAGSFVWIDQEFVTSNQ